MTTAAASLLERAATERREAAESFERCDTDGFLSQWAHGLTAQRLEAQAEIEANGGRAEFPALFDLAGNRVPAKLITVRDKFRGYGTRQAWAIVDPATGRYAGFVTPAAFDMVNDPDGRVQGKAPQYGGRPVAGGKGTSIHAEEMRGLSPQALNPERPARTTATATERIPCDLN